jgi:hypothetical protein
MMDIIPSNFWWNRITGPNFIVNSVARSLSEGKSVFLLIPDDLPWRAEMRAIIENAYRQDYGNSNVYFSPVDVSEECQEEMPGDYILKTFAKKNQTGYRQGSSQSIQSYIINKGILNNRIIWVKGLTNRSIKIWKDFCEAFNSSSLETGLFVIEINESIKCVDSDHISVINYSSFVNPYDVQLFSQYLLFDNHNYDGRWKEYLSILVSKLCENDGEIAEHIISNYSLKKSSMIEIIVKVSDQPEFGRRGASPESNNLLRFARQNDIGEINKRIWAAQLQYLFPIVENIRISIITKVSNQISPYLHEVIQFGESVTDVLDLEVGSLDFLIQRHLNDSVLKEKTKLLHDCRNKLAHRSICDLDEIEALMKMVDVFNQ